MMAYMDQKEITNFLAQELFYQQFITLEGLNSGVPTRTTPTLTPTTLRNIEQTFIELQSKPESHENEAGFVPPMVHSIGNNQYISASDSDVYTTISAANSSRSNTIWNSSLSQCSSDSNTTTSPTPAELHKNMLQVTTSSSMMLSAPTSRRNMGGRKPNKDNNISPEEEERRRVRRERNKAAAARCRKRRVDHTNQLIEETEVLEREKQKLEKELRNWTDARDHLECALQVHRPKCRMHARVSTITNVAAPPPSPPDVKPFSGPAYYDDDVTIKAEMLDASGNANHNHGAAAPPIDPDEVFCLPSPAKRIMLSSAAFPPIAKPNRPNSLNVAVSRQHQQLHHQQQNAKNFSELTGIQISTPSSGMQFNFESLMVGGTGLTPVTAPLVPNNCSTQQRIPVSMCDMTSPESCAPPKLVSL